VNRRSFIQKGLAGAVFAGAPVSFSFGSSKPAPAGIGMCDWNLGQSADPSYIPLAGKVGLQAIQVSVGTTPDNIPLREDSVRQQYLQLGQKHNIRFCSVAAGSILHRNAMTTDPKNAIFVIDALEAASVLGAGNVLVALFGDGDLLQIDESGNYTNIPANKFAEYKWKEKEVERLIKVIKQQLVPRAEDLGVVIGLENSLTANQNLQIIDEIGSSMVQVYYDIANSWRRGYDVPGEIRHIGNERMCEVHIKNEGSRLIYGNEGVVDMGRCAAALKAIGFDKWFVLETSGRSGRFEEDTMANIDYVREVFF